MHVNTEWVPIGDARFTSLSSAVPIATTAPASGTAFSALVPAPNHAIVIFETQDGRVRYGADPSGTVGQLVKKEDSLFIESSPDAIRTLRVIENAASASMQIFYFK